MKNSKNFRTGLVTDLASVADCYGVRELTATQYRQRQSMFKAGQLATFNAELLADKCESVKRTALSVACTKIERASLLSPESAAFIGEKYIEKAERRLSAMLADSVHVAYDRDAYEDGLKQSMIADDSDLELWNAR